MSKYSTDFLKELGIIAESFAKTVVDHNRTPEDSYNFEDAVSSYVNNMAPEEQSNLLFLCGMLIVQLSNVEIFEKRSAVATALVFKKVLDAHLNAVAAGGTMIKALTFPLVYPRLDKESKNEIVSSHCDC
jgi:hypothetical protein